MFGASKSVAALVLSFSMCLTKMDATSLPKPSGPYDVGRIAYHFVDLSRPEAFSTMAHKHREVMVHIWYPMVAGSAKKAPTAPYLPGFDAAKPQLSEGDITDLFRPAKYEGVLPDTDTVENGPIVSGNDKFPLLLFSHGWGNPTFLYTAEIEDIVSHGYIVAAVDHPYDTTFTQFPDGRLALFAQKAFDAAAKKPNGLIQYARERVEIMAEDNRFVLNQLMKYANTKSLKAPFWERVDEKRIGAFGHSIGGLTAARTCQIDSRVRACIDQDSDDDRGSPFIETDLNQTETQPFLLFVVASADEISPQRVNPDDASLAKMKKTRAEYDAALQKTQANQLAQLSSIAGGAYRVSLYGLPGFTHRSFTDQTLLPPQTNPEQSLHNFQVAQSFTLAFFNKYLKGDQHTILDTEDVSDTRAHVEKFPAK